MTVPGRAWRGFAGAVSVVLALVVALSAHPSSTTTVAIDLRASRTFEVEIGSDARSLVTKLEALSGAPLATEARSTAEVAARLTSLGSTFLEHVNLCFDGVRVRSAIAGIAVDENGQATMTLTGERPEGVRTVTWSTALVYGAYPLAVRGADRQEVVRWLQGGETSEPVALGGAGEARAIGRGVRLGFTHIVPSGVDHILFVVGLFLLSTSVRQLLLQVSAFTLAHSVTLGLCLYGVVSLPSRVVEPLIALSVAYVGIENLLTSRLHPWRLAIVFTFGLLHGLGFAEALAGLHLSRDELLPMLISFNAGVEIGQLTVVAAAALVLYGVFHARLSEWRRPVARLASAAVGTMGLVWTVERLLF